MPDANNIITIIEDWINHSGKWGRGLRIAGYLLQVLSVVPLVVLGGCAKELFAPDYSLIQNSATLLSFIGAWVTIWGTGRSLLAHGNAYGLRTGQLMDLKLYLSCLTDHELKAEEILNVILSFRRQTLEKSVADSINDKLIKAILDKLPSLKSKTP